MRRNQMILFICVILVSGCVRQRLDTGDTGNTLHSLLVDGLNRTYSIHVPSSYNDSPVPMVMALHGGGGSAEKMAHLTNFDALSDQEGFIVVYPEGVENRWNDGRRLEQYKTHRENIDDVKFISALIDKLVKEYNIDENRIYATGISNGAMMSCRLACELSGKIAAIAMVAGAMPEELLDCCAPSESISILIMNGTEDPLILWKGGEITVGRQSLGTTLSVSKTVQFWVDHNKCTSPVIAWLPDIQDDGTRVRKEVYGYGENGIEVILYAIEGGGHTWPGGLQYASEYIISRTCYDINASEVIWQFFSEHVRGQSVLRSI
ncbi:MAG: phospholipase [Theionarchaea archaeon]|nr:phospholipase [Theionarchaea archaeon]